MDWTSPDNTVRLLTGHVVERLRDIPDESVHCVVTSPPYWGLRRYGVDGELGTETLHDCLGLATGQPCGECFVCHLVKVFREVRRVLHPSGTVWLNLGDSFHNGDKGGYERTTTGKQASNHGTVKGLTNNRLWMPGLKPKDQVMIPARTALALQADGWWVRSDIIWAKPNGLPESVTDRPTKSYEFVFLLTKSQAYFWDAEAVREPLATGIGNQADYLKRIGATPNRQNGIAGQDGRRTLGLNSATWHPGRNTRSVWTISPQAFRGAMCRACRTVYLDGTQRFAKHEHDKAKPVCPNCGAWDQWLSHFAVMPERLAERCIMAGTSESGVCPKCGEPWRRVVSKERIDDRPNRVQGRLGDRINDAHGTDGRAGNRCRVKSDTVGWEPGCECGDHARVPATVLDLFAGTGTTLAVARRLGRHAIGIELNPNYAEICKARVMAPPRRPRTKPQIRPDARQQTLF